MPTYKANSYHINVQQGDAAIYDLFEDGQIISRVLVDAGKGNANNIVNLRNFIRNYPQPFDAVVITHWDSDHYVGLYNLFIEEWAATTSGTWRPSFFRFLSDGTPLTRFYCPYFENTPPDRGDLKSSYKNFESVGSGAYMTVKYGSAASVPVAALGPENVIGTDFFNTIDNPPTLAQAQKFKTPLDLITYHSKSNWQQNHPGAPGLYCVAQNWTYIGPGPGLEIFDTESSTYTNQSSIAAMLIWPDLQKSLYTAGDRDDPREQYIAAWSQCQGGPGQADHVTTVKAGHHGAATSTATDVLNKFNPENIIFSAGTDYGHPRYELINYLAGWNQLNKLRVTPHEYRDFEKPVVSTVFPYWLAKDKNNNWVVLPINKMSTIAMDDDKYEEFQTNQEAMWNDIGEEMIRLVSADPGYDTSAIRQDPVAAYQAAMLAHPGAARFDKIQEICNLASGQWKALSKVGSDLYPVMSAKGWLYDGVAQVAGLRKDSIAFIRVTHTQPWYQDGSVAVYFCGGKQDGWFRNNGNRKDPTKVAVTLPTMPRAAVRDARPVFPVLPARVSGAFPSSGLALMSDDLYINPDDDPDEAIDPLPASGKPAKVLPLAPYPAITWPPGIFFYSTGGIKPQGAGVTATECLTTSPFGYFISGLHMQLIGLSPTQDPTGWSSVLQKDELTTWFTTVMQPFLGSVTLQVMLDSSTTKFNDMQLTVPILFGAGVVFNSSSVAAAFPKTITPLTGVVVDESMVILGLDPTKSPAVLKTTSNEMLKYLSLDRQLPFVLDLTLDPSKATGKRNAVWFVPGQNYATTFRSVWTADASGIADLNTFLGKFGLDISVETAEVIAVKKVKWGVPNLDYESSATLGISVNFGNTQMAAYLELKMGGTDLTLICVDGGPSLTQLVDWVAKPFSSGAAKDAPPKGKDVESWIAKIGENIKPRQVKVSLDQNDALVYCEVSFEVDLTIGQAQGAGQTVASLFTFSWSKDIGLGLSGSFFPAAPPLPFINDKALIPGYEEYRDLQPEAKDAVSSIDLAYLIPGMSITEVPGSVHPAIQAASFSIAADEYTFFAAITTVETPAAAAADSSPVPHLRLGLLSLGATYSTTLGLSLKCDLQISLTGKQDAKSRQALLLGSLEYMRTSRAQHALSRRGKLRSTDSVSSWQVSAGIQDLQVGTLYELFDSDSQDGVLGLIGHIKIAWLDFVYNYSSGQATDFTFSGLLLLGPLQLELDYHYPSSGLWKFHASLTEQPGVSVTLNQLVGELQNQGSPQVVLPGFVGDVVLTANNAILEVTVQSSVIGGNSTVFVTVDLKLGDFEVLFVQFQEKGETAAKRLFRAAVTGLGEVDNVPIIDKISQPFDDMYFLYVVDGNPDDQGITKAELDAVNGILPATSRPLVVMQTKANPTPADILIKPGAHFVVAMRVDNVPTAVLDYGFTPDKETPSGPHDKAAEVLADQPDTGSGQATLKKTIGPLTINNIGLQYKDGSLGILLDATFKLGPIELDLIGFSLMVPLTGFTINSVLTPQVSINGLAVSFNEPPTSMAGMFAKLNEALYIGGLTVSFDPYVLTAAGAYGTITDAQGHQFKTVAVFAELQGPLIELEFAEVSGMTLGFGYNSHLTPPTVDSVTSFPLVGPKAVPSGNAIDIFGTLQTPSPPAPAPPWIIPQSGSLWLAAGLNATALSTLSVSALVVLEFSSSVTLGLFAQAVAQFPTTSPAILYAELGLAGTIDFSAGTLLIQAKLSPASYILDPSCHLTGGFALGYWFGSSPHAGDFVFSLGGYHPAYRPPAHYPTPAPDRLGIWWSLDGCLTITGGSYMAVTPKACMAGASLHAALSLGPLSASFDAWADFLVNFQPFWFQGDGGVSVRVEFTLDLWIVTIHIDVEIGASLAVWGPSMAGTVHVDFWVFGFDINFGSSGDKPDAAVLVGDFYKKVLLQNKDSSEHAVEGSPANDHTVTCVKGLVPSAHGTTETAPAATWNVRGGVFAFSIKSVFPFTHAAIDQGGQVPVPPAVVNPVYSKPMWRSKDQPLDTTVTISIFEGQEGSGATETIQGFQIAGNIAELPTAIWGDYTTEADPLRSSQGNQIQTLLNGDDPTVSLLNGVTVTAPRPYFSTDPIPPFNVLLSNIDIVNDGEVFDVYNVPRCEGPWDPVPVADRVAQYAVVEKAWLNPGAGADAAQKAATMWATLWAGPGETPPEIVGGPPAGMLGPNGGVFEMDYLEAPMVSVSA